MNLDDLDEVKQTDDDPRDWSKPSRAVIAFHDKPYRGIVLWHVGAHIEASFEQIGSHEIDELGFDQDPPHVGITVWEGTLEGGRYNPYQGDYDDCWLRGEYREPTEEEWTAIREGRCPWNADDWLRPGAQP